MSAQACCVLRGTSSITVHVLDAPRIHIQSETRYLVSYHYKRLLFFEIAAML